jgi:hypothetical protein
MNVNAACHCQMSSLRDAEGMPENIDRAHERYQACKGLPSDVKSAQLFRGLKRTHIFAHLSIQMNGPNPISACARRYVVSCVLWVAMIGPLALQLYHVTRRCKICRRPCFEEMAGSLGCEL